MLKLENSIRGLSFSRVAFDLTIQGKKNNVGSDTVNDVTPTFIIEPNHLFTGCPVKTLHIISILAFHLV